MILRNDYNPKTEHIVWDRKKPVTYVDINAEDTVDEKIVKALRAKIDIASQVLGEELRSWI